MEYLLIFLGSELGAEERVNYILYGLSDDKKETVKKNKKRSSK